MAEIIGSKAYPNPGSTQASAQGCICPIMDNNHGHHAPWPPDGWWIVEGCPVHDQRTEEGDTDE